MKKREALKRELHHNVVRYRIVLQHIDLISVRRIRGNKLVTFPDANYRELTHASLVELHAMYLDIKRNLDDLCKCDIDALQPVMFETIEDWRNTSYEEATNEWWDYKAEILQRYANGENVEDD